MQDAIDRKDDNAVDAPMLLVDAEFEKIALATNPSIVPDRIKYAKEVADTNIASDAKSAAGAKAAEAKALADAKAAADAKRATDMKAFKFNKNASYSSEPLLGRNLIANDEITA